eukprot:scaffold3337_cov67-Phaeocystis_antarctica.AAC.5
MNTNNRHARLYQIRSDAYRLVCMNLNILSYPFTTTYTIDCIVFQPHPWLALLLPYHNVLPRLGGHGEGDAHPLIRRELEVASPAECHGVIPARCAVAHIERRQFSPQALLPPLETRRRLGLQLLEAHLGGRARHLVELPRLCQAAEGILQLAHVVLAASVRVVPRAALPDAAVNVVELRTAVAVVEVILVVVVAAVVGLPARAGTAVLGLAPVAVRVVLVGQVLLAVVVSLLLAIRSMPIPTIAPRPFLHAARALRVVELVQSALYRLDGGTQLLVERLVHTAAHPTRFGQQPLEALDNVNRTVLAPGGDRLLQAGGVCSGVGYVRPAGALVVPGPSVWTALQAIYHNVPEHSARALIDVRA